MQHGLFEAPDAFHSRVITRRSDFDELFNGFTTLRAISYVASPTILLEILQKLRFAQLELILGESLQPTSREAIAASGVGVIEQLAELMESGRLKVLVPKRTIHTKLYLLSSTDRTRVILSSANLTETARDASRQTNYAWFADLPPGHPWLLQVEGDYEAHAKQCSLFLGDLLSLIREAKELPRDQVIEAWVAGTTPTDVGAESGKLVGETAEWVFDPAHRDEPVYSIRLPEGTVARKQVERVLGRLGANAVGNEVRLERSSFLTHVEQSLRLPLMQVDAHGRAVRLLLGDVLSSVAAPLADSEATDAGLEHLENYIETVDCGEAIDRVFAKTAMYEAMLYMLAAPFANEHMKVLRKRYGVLERRGPKMLYLAGPSSNGKTTFLQFALFLLTGRQVRPLPATDFTKTKLRLALALRTCFPLVFDDVNPAQRPGFEEILKSYWENWWSADGVSPQIVLSSNNQSLREWAKSRVQRIDFDVHFAPSEINSAKLAQLFAQPSQLFGLFARLYRESLARLEDPQDHELFLARDVMRELYNRARRHVPAFFPHRPLEQTYDPGRMRWRDLLERSKQAGRRRDRERTMKLIIDNPAEFDRWLSRDRLRRSGWLASFLRNRKG